MNNSRLTKAYPIRLTHPQDEAIKNLVKIGFNRSKFIRAAIQEKLKRDYRKLLNQYKYNNMPDWAKI